MGEQTIPAPVGGWNATDALASMAPTDAVDLINWVPGNGIVAGRGGSRSLLSVGSSVDTLIPYDGIASGTASPKFLAAYNGHIYDISDFTTPVSLGSGFTSSAWQFASFDNKLVLVNGADDPQVYDGTTLTPMVITSLSPPTVGALSSTTGTLTAATYYYRVSATNSNGESLASTESSLVLGATGGVTIPWTLETGATGYKIYGRSTGAELLLGSVDAYTTSYVDDGSVTPSGALPAANTTAVDGTLLVGTVNFKGRAFYWENAAQRFWYAAAGAFQGSLTKFDFSNFTQRGGHIVQIVTWTRDSGDGVDDYIAFIFSTGETLIYQGDDPAQILQWSMVGRYQIGKPLGVRAHVRFASAEVILTDDGFEGLDEAIQNARTEIEHTFGGRIFRAAKRAAKLYSGNFGWQPIFYPQSSLFLVNVPISSTESEQYVKNTNTGAWCRFQGWPARCFALYKDRLYFGTAAGDIKLADVTSTDPYEKAYSDDDLAIQYDCLTAYQTFGQPGLKSQLTAARVITNVFDANALSLGVFVDYKTKPLPAVRDPNEQIQGQWDVSFWDADYWASDDNDPASLQARPIFRPVHGFGFATALSVRYRSIVQNVVWYSTTFVFNQGGIN